MKVERFIYGLGFFLVVGVFLALAALLNYGQASQTHKGSESNKLTKDKKIVFSDEFDGLKLDDGKWATCYDWRRSTESGCTNQGNLEQQWYSDDQVVVKDGKLIITAEKRPIDVAVQNRVETFQYQSGMINSGRGSTSSSIRWAGTYGYYEAKMKFDSGQGVWPAFWLLPVDKIWPPELDVMEFVGSKPGEILQTVHWNEQGKSVKSEVIIKAEDYSQGWHIYGVDWRDDGIDWYIDGVKTRSYTGQHIPSKPMEIILNLAIGGLLPGNPDTTTPFPRHLEVDYVRVYQASDQMKPHQY